MSNYTAEDYADLNLNEYRERFPEETKPLSDQHIYDIVMSTDDDMEDDAWRALFKSEWRKSGQPGT